MQRRGGVVSIRTNAHMSVLSERVSNWTMPMASCFTIKRSVQQVAS
jgi:hypothetical protein